MERLRQDVHWLMDRLVGSVPSFSYRHQGHMNWDLTLPALVGYFATMLYNSNNIGPEGGPVTQPLQTAVMNDIGGMLHDHLEQTQ